MDYVLVDNDEFRDMCFYEAKPSKVAPFLLTSKDRLPKAISDGASTYYLAKNDYLGFGYWNPSSYDPNVWASTEDQKGKTKILKEEINGCLEYLTAFYF